AETVGQRGRAEGRERRDHRVAGDGGERRLHEGVLELGEAAGRGDRAHDAAAEELHLGGVGRLEVDGSVGGKRDGHGDSGQSGTQLLPYSTPAAGRCSPRRPVPYSLRPNWYTAPIMSSEA